MTRVNAIGPLAHRQFRVLKWFGVIYLLMTMMFLWYHWIGFATTAGEIWRNAGIEMQRWVASVTIFGRESPRYLDWLMVLTALMAIYQQTDAYVSRNAQFMASMPVTRGRLLQAQLLGGLSIILGTMALYAVGCCLIAAHYHEIFELGALISPIPGHLLRQVGPLVPLVITLRITMILVSVYLLMSALFGLFGNSLSWIGMLISLRFWYAMLTDHGSTISQKLHAIGFLPDVMFSKVLGILSASVPNTYWMRPYAHYRGMPWDALPWFVPIHLALWAIGLVVLWQQRKHLAVEKLGGFFLFPASRWALLGLMMMWLLPLPLLELTVYDVSANKQVFDPMCLILLIPAVIVFVVGYWLLFQRPKMRLNKRLAALALAVLLVGPGVAPARAEAEFTEPELFSYDSDDIRVGWRYESGKLQADDAWGKKIDELTQRICEIVGDNKAALNITSKRYASDSFEGSLNPMESYNQDPERTDFSGYESVLSAFGGPLFTVTLGPEFQPAESQPTPDDETKHMNVQKTYAMQTNTITENQMLDALKQCGFVTLAVAFEMRTEKEEGMLYQDGLRLTWYQQITGDETSGDNFTKVEFSANSPFTVKGAEAIDQEIMKNSDVRRTTSFSNGVYDTMTYEFYSTEAGLSRWIGASTGTVILKDGVLWRLMLSVPSRHPRQSSFPLRAAQSLLNGAVIQGALGQADVEPLSSGLATWQAGSAHSGGAACTLTLGRAWPIEQETHWMVKLD